MQPIKTGEIVRGLRKNKGVTQEELAEVLGISAAAISRWERGTTLPDIQFFPILARYFQVSIDFLMGFSSEAGEAERNNILQEVLGHLRSPSPLEAVKAWTYYDRQYPNDDQLRFDLANQMLIHLDTVLATGEVTFNTFVSRLIAVFEQCTGSDDLKIKQGAYYQMGNLYIALQNYDAAEKALAQIPEQAVSPQLLRNMISVHKGEYKAAEKAIHESVYTAMNEIIGQLGHMVVMREEEGKAEEVLALLRTQQRLYDLFEPMPVFGVGVVLQIALQLCEMKNNDEALDELEEAIQLLKAQTNLSPLHKAAFFTKAALQDHSASLQSMKPAYASLAKRCFALLEESDRKDDIRQALDQLLGEVSDESMSRSWDDVL